MNSLGTGIFWHVMCFATKFSAGLFFNFSC